MKLEIDTVQKTIILKSHVTIAEIKKELKNLVDGDQYRIISDVIYHSYPYYYLQPPIVTPCITDFVSVEPINGTFTCITPN